MSSALDDYESAQETEEQLKSIGSLATILLMTMGCVFVVVASLLLACADYLEGDELSGLSAAGKLFGGTAVMLAVALIGAGAFAYTMVQGIDLATTPTPEPESE